MPSYRYPRPPAYEITPRHLFEQRRRLMKQTGSALLAASVPGLLSLPAHALTGRIEEAERSGFVTDEEKTPLSSIRGYANFYEFGTDKEDPKNNAHKMQTDPWSVSIEGEVNKPGKVALEDLIKPHTLEERIYRLRCVEAWSMVIPWIGFPLKDLLERFEPTSRARYVVFETLYEPDQMPNLSSDIMDWPYKEGLRMDEATHPLTIMAVGLYGEVLPNENGAPLRLVVPWKYGFKSIKSVVTIRLQEERPVSSWEAERPREYGFFANVNPNVRHPRWHQATERRIGEDRRRRTEMFNGYGEQVAHLYEGMDLEENF